jgi:hypothetical protein
MRQRTRQELIENAKKHISFLRALHELEITTRLPNHVECIRRYQELWLPMVIKYGKSKQLIPPADVAWLWHCHRLAPMHYKTYMRNKYGENCMMEANPPFVFQIMDSNSEEDVPTIATETQQIWKELYPDESFFLSDVDTITSDKDMLSTNHDTICLVGSFDLIASTQRQATFLWQVSGERFEDEDFLEEGVANYTKFLKIRCKAKKEKIILVPTYQIDLFWHTHILTSIQQYDDDCLEHVGELLHHDDSLTDRSEGGVLNTSFKATCNLWKQEYGIDYAVCGGMYRGEPPPEYYSTKWKPSNGVEDWLVSINLHLIGKTGASSTAPPKAWATIDGLASDGSQAFIPVNETSPIKLRRQDYKSNYILGKSSNGVGYFHMETRDAQEILYARVSRKIQKLEWDIAFRHTCCCGSFRSTAAMERELSEMKKVQKILLERLHALQPWEPLETKRLEQSNYVTSDGTWLYPPYLYTVAGGACGGVVLCSAGVGGGSACGGEYPRDIEISCSLLLT